MTKKNFTGYIDYFKKKHGDSIADIARNLDMKYHSFFSLYQRGDCSFNKVIDISRKLNWSLSEYLSEDDPNDILNQFKNRVEELEKQIDRQTNMIDMLLEKTKNQNG